MSFLRRNRTDKIYKFYDSLGRLYSLFLRAAKDYENNANRKFEELKRTIRNYGKDNPKVKSLARSYLAFKKYSEEYYTLAEEINLAKELIQPQIRLIENPDVANIIKDLSKMQELRKISNILINKSNEIAKMIEEGRDIAYDLAGIFKDQVENSPLEINDNELRNVVRLASQEIEVEKLKETNPENPEITEIEEKIKQLKKRIGTSTD